MDTTGVQCRGSRGGVSVGKSTQMLSPFQTEVAQLFYSLPESKHFLLAGGAALLAHRISSRPTRDLDFFTWPGHASVDATVAAFESAARERKWSVTRVKQSPDFCRLQVDGGEQLIVDFAVDSAPVHPVVITRFGPSYSPEELGARKLLALFERAEARDFTDVYLLATRFGRPMLIKDAKLIDPGFEPAVLAQMFLTLGRFRDDELPVDHDQIPGLREYFTDWREELTRR